MQQATKSGAQVQFSSTSSNGQPTEGLSEDIVKNGQVSSDGKTFTYSWTSDGTDDIDIDEIMDLLSQKFNRIGPNRLSRSSRNIKENIARKGLSLERTKSRALKMQIWVAIQFLPIRKSLQLFPESPIEREQFLNAR